MVAGQEKLVLEFEVGRPPDELEARWADLPEVYEADDPREQPHRIELVEETEDGGVYETTWRGPLGLPYTLTETLHDEGPGRWRFVVPGPGFEIVDRHEVQPPRRELTSRSVRRSPTRTSSAGWHAS